MLDGHAVNAAPAEPGVYSFGEFRLDTVRRALLLHQTQIALSAQLFDTLLYLVRHHGRLVTRDELLREIWPGRSVEQGSLDRALSSLRLALREGDADEKLFITVRGRGYRFAAPMTFTPMARDPEPGAAPAPPAQPGPAPKHGKIRAILLAVLVVSAALAWRLRPVHVAAPFAPPPRSVAVLPFTNEDADGGKDVFSLGLSDELINALGRVGTIRVAARQSSFSFRNRQASIAEIARQLNVRTLLEGSVRRQGTRVRVTAELIDAATGFQLWANSYDRDQGDILSMQGEITAAVIGSLKIVLAGPDAARLTLGGTANAAAFEACLIGSMNITNVDHAQNQLAIADLNRAIALDPGYARAYALRADARMMDYADLAADPVRQQKIKEAAQNDADHAVALAPDLDAGHVARATVLKLSLSHLAEAGAELQRAADLAPNSKSALMNFAEFQRDLGHPAEAIEAASRAVELDPLTPATHRILASALALAGQFGRANDALRRARLLPPANPDVDRIYSGTIDLLSGDYVAALKTCAGERDYYDVACLAEADHATGRIAKAQADMAKLRALRGDACAFLLVRLYAEWGQADEAVRWLQTAYRLRDPGLLGMRSDPALASIRARPEYKEIESKLGFPP